MHSRKTIGCHNLIIAAWLGRGARRAAGGAAGGRRPRTSRSHSCAPPWERAGRRHTQPASRRQTTHGKTKGMLPATL